MVEEAAGTKMYGNKRQLTQKIIEKKDSKLVEFQAVSNLFDLNFFKYSK